MKDQVSRLLCGISVAGLLFCAGAARATEYLWDASGGTTPTVTVASNKTATLYSVLDGAMGLTRPLCPIPQS